MTSAAKHTAGPAVVSLYGSFRTLVRSGDEQTGRKIAITWVGMTNPKRGPDESRDAYHERCRTTELERARQNEANAEFIAEAFTVAHETGLTPRQLAERCEKLEATLERIERGATAVLLDAALSDAPDGFDECPINPGVLEQVAKDARAALSKATAGGAV